MQQSENTYRDKNCLYYLTEEKICLYFGRKCNCSNCHVKIRPSDLRTKTEEKKK